jgi:hypothetical protein
MTIAGTARLALSGLLSWGVVPVLVSLLAAQSHALSISINDNIETHDPSSGAIAVFTQVAPVSIDFAAFDSTTTEMSVGVVGTFAAGSRRRTHPIFFFELPAVATSGDIVSATANLRVLRKADFPSWNLDLWGLGFSTTGIIDPDWRLFADTDLDSGVGITSRSKIQDDWVTPGTPLAATVTTNSAGDANLLAFLRSLYDAGAVGGDLAIFRLSPDVFLVPETGGTPQYRIEFDTKCLSAPQLGCRQPTVPRKAKLLLKKGNRDGARLLVWKWLNGSATAATDFGDPVKRDDYFLCVYDGSRSLVLEVAAPAGDMCRSRPCWKGLGNPTGNKGFRYKDKEQTPDGLRKVLLKPGVDGKAKALVKGEAENLPDLPVPMDLPVTVQLQATNGVCWGAVYDADGVSVNDATKFKAKAGSGQ